MVKDAPTFKIGHNVVFFHHQQRLRIFFELGERVTHDGNQQIDHDHDHEEKQRIQNVEQDVVVLRYS